jgi:replicative DNA helicase
MNNLLNDYIKVTTEEPIDDAVVHINDAIGNDVGYSTPYSSGYAEIDNAILGGFRAGDLVVITGKPGAGKCHGKGTKILMYDGSIKHVEDIIVGDKLMGDDSRPRNVLSLARGIDKLYKIIPLRSGENFIVNQEHILVLKKNKHINNRITIDGIRKHVSYKIIKNQETEISVKDYLQRSKFFKHYNKLFKIGVKFKETKVVIDPYFIGLWLADGSSANVGITTPDKEIVKYLYSYAKSLNLKVTKQIINYGKNKTSTYSLVREKKFKPTNKSYLGGYGNVKSLTSYLRKLNLINNKHIPNIYKINSRDNRLKLLAGLLDGDGYYNKNCYEIVSKYKTLTQDIIYLCRSLGISCNCTIKHNKKYNRDYFRIGIYGDLEEIPVLLSRKKAHKSAQRRDSLRTGFSIKSLGVGEYFGFTLDGNGRYLLGDFTVTHNTTMAMCISVNLSQQNFPSIFFSYEVCLRDLVAKFSSMGMPGEKLLLYTPKRNTTGKLDWVKKKIKEGLEKFNTKFVFIDDLDALSPTNTRGLENKRLILTEICQELKNMAVELEIVIFFMAHVVKTRDKEIVLEDIAETSGIGQKVNFAFSVSRATETKMINGILEEVEGERSVIKFLKNRLTGQKAKFSVIMENNILKPL